MKVKAINCTSSDMHEKLANSIVSMRDFRESSPTMYDNLIITTSASSSNSESTSEFKCLLEKPWIKEYLKCSENVCKNVCSEKLPDTPFEVDDNEEIAVKYVKLIKQSEPLGATIKCKTDGRIVISRIMGDGVAVKSGVIQISDSIFGINDILRAIVGYNGRNDPNHPVPEAAISFERGGILEILVTDVPMWLQVANLGNVSLVSITSMIKKKNDNF
uniref:PDZ domain-containing protein n=1 Tax=Strongyloides venezuelensis TaxID=75913 RepID=A0A0K0FP85_STRVS